MSLYLTDAEVDGICEGLEQDAAKVRFLRRLGFKVDRKPNGRPLAWRPTEPAATAAPASPHTGPNVIGLNQWSRSRHGSQTQGR